MKTLKFLTTFLARRMRSIERPSEPHCENGTTLDEMSRQSAVPGHAFPWERGESSGELFRGDCRVRRRRALTSSGSVIHRRGGDPAGRWRGDDRHRRWALRWLRSVPAQGQAGVPLQPAGSGTVPLGRR